MRLADYLSRFEITALYQNHASRNLVGGPILGPPSAGWTEFLRTKYRPIYDLRHATVEGGLSWPVTWRVIRDRVRVIYFQGLQLAGVGSLSTSHLVPGKWTLP